MRKDGLVSPHSTFRPLSWRSALFVVFALSGLSVGTWTSRVPAVQTSLHLSTAVIGDMVLGMSTGAIFGLIAAPVLSHRLGVRSGIVVSLGSTALGTAVVGLATTLLGSIPLVLVGMVFIGIGNGAVDVIMNVSAASVERKIHRTTMPMMHAMFSFGTVIGAAIGALAAATGVVVAWHYLFIGILIMVAAVITVRYIPEIHQEAAIPELQAKLSQGATDATGARSGLASQAPSSSNHEREPLPPGAAVGTSAQVDSPSPVHRLTLGDRLRAWQDITLVFIGVVMLGMAFAEGGANDWIALASVTGHHRTQAEAALVLDVFVIAMTVGRLLGGVVVDRIGRVLAIRVTALSGIVGIVLFINAPALWAYVLGVALWGLGASLGFPLGISAAADDPHNATLRVSTVAMVGYCSFLVGPPLIGWLAGVVGILNALYVVAMLLLASLLASGAVRKRTSEQPAPPRSG